MNYDLTEMPADYDAGRGYAPDVLHHWLQVIDRNVTRASAMRILDLGCGTGRYSNALADHFDAHVEALDPSEKMLEQARAKRHPRVRFHHASGERIPLPDHSIDLVFISMVFHHFESPLAVARECRRILRGGGVVCLRAGTVEQIEGYAYVPFFARTRELLRVVLDERAFIESVFSHAGLTPDHHELVRSEVATCWREYAEKVSYKADSVLSQLSDEEFDAGLEALRRFAEQQGDSDPVVEDVDFFVFRKVEESA